MPPGYGVVPRIGICVAGGQMWAMHGPAVQSTPAGANGQSDAGTPVA